MKRSKEQKGVSSQLPQIEASEVERFHDAVLETLKKHLEIPGVAFIDRKSHLGSESWKKLESGKIEFELTTRQAFSLAKRTRTGDPIEVFRLLKFDNVWASWFEKWQAVGDESFLLVAVSLALWSGEQYDRTKAAILRAEWDHIQNPESDAPAQPHWQIDHLVGFKVVQASASESPLVESPALGLEELEEIDEDRLEELTSPLNPSYADGLVISAYHLGMRGDWSYNATRGWVNSLSAKGDGLIGWLDLCLQYLTGQLVRYGIRKE